MKPALLIPFCALLAGVAAAEEVADPQKRKKGDAEADQPAAAATSSPAPTVNLTVVHSSSSGGGGGGGFDKDEGEAILIIVAVAAAVVVPILVTEDDYSTTARFPRHPYTTSGQRYLRLADDDTKLEPGRWAGWGGRASVDALAAREGQVIGASGLVELPWRFGAEADWHQVHAASDRHGALPSSFGGGFATYRFAQASWAEFRLGVGARTVRDGHPSTGVAYLYEAEFFPVRPLTLGLHWDWTSTGTHILSEMRATAGATWRGGEVYGGYSRLRYDDHAAEGAVAGLGWWF
jgi:hypothetical protein